MKPTFKEMLAGIEAIQSTVVMPRIMATGEMDILWETGLSYRLLGFLKDNGTRLLDNVFLENRDIRGLLRKTFPEVEIGGKAIKDPGLTEKQERWSSSLPESVTGDAPPGDAPPLEGMDEENARLKQGLDGLILLLDDLARRNPDGSGIPGLGEWQERIQKVIKENVARQNALSEELLKLWQG